MGGFGKAVRAILGLATVTFAGGLLAAPATLFTPVPLSRASAPNAPQARTQATPVKLDRAGLARMRPGEEVPVALPSGRTNRLVLESIVDHGAGDVSWRGHVKEKGPAARVVLTLGRAGTYGAFESTDGAFRLVPGGAHDWLLDQDAEEKLAPPATRRDDGLEGQADARWVPDLKRVTWVPADRAKSSAKVAPTPQVQLDVMFVVTRGYADRLGAGMTTRLNFLVQRANDAFTASEVAITAKMVNYTVVDYPDTQNDDAALRAITPGDPQFNAAVFGRIEAIRNQWGADVVSFLRNGTDSGAGLAWIPSTLSPTPGLMYNTLHSCVDACDYLWVHMLAHNLGAQHDRRTQAWLDGGVDNALVAPGATPYAFGYVFCKSGVLNCNPNVPGGCGQQPECSPNDPSNFSEIMSYFHNSATRLHRFSNAQQFSCLSTAPGNDGVPRPCGIAQGDPNSADAAATMNGLRLAASAINPSVASTAVPGSLQFTTKTFRGTEGGFIGFTVSRVNGSGGAVSVDYSVASGSATLGIDFPVTSGTLAWADGDTTDKTFYVPAFSDGTAEGAEAFTATLSNPAGAAGVYINYPASASGILLEAWPPGGVLPPGYVDASGAAAPWAVATDFSADADSYSLKSGALDFNALNCSGPNGAVPCPSVLQATVTTAAGPLTFAYQVSSFPTTGFFEFLIDGTVVLKATGPRGTKIFSTDVTAGTHTFVWRFRTQASTPCSTQLQAEPNCSDRAWIDGVSFPLPQPPSTTTTLASSANPADFGGPVTLTATVTGATTGTVEFRDAGLLIPGCAAVALVSGTAACTTSTLALGTHPITAAFTGTASASASLSAPLNQLMRTLVTLTVARSGAGTGTVTSSVGGINCGATCNTTVDKGTAVTLTATPANGSVFTGWTGGCTGAGACTLSMGANTTVTAEFGQVVLTPTLTIANPGLAFGGQSMKTTAPSISLDLVNSGTGTLNISGIALAGTNAGDFTLANACGATLASTASCKLTVTFTPQAAGARTASLSVTTNGGNASLPITGTGEASLVTHYYRSILRRAPDAGGKAFWEAEAARMQARGVNLNETWYSMAGAFYTSPEYVAFNRGAGDFVADLYNTFFNRPADGGGLAFWTGQIAQGLPREVVLAGFMFSPEFTAFTQGIFGNTSVRKEIDVVTDFYRGLLARLPDDGGLAFWVQQFRTAQCQGGAAVNAQVESISSLFATSGEYANRARNNPQFVGDLYNAFLRRGGDLAGTVFWIGQLGTGVLTREQVRQAFVASGEFQGRVQQVIAQGCLP